MITHAFAEQFAREWLEAWNQHDLAAILSHYAEDFVMASPYIVTLTGNGDGTLQGKAAVGAYWRKALDINPQLRFSLERVLVGVDSVVLCYQGARGPAAETFFFDQHGKVTRAAAHYT